MKLIKLIFKLIFLPFVMALIFFKPIVNFKFIHSSSETFGHFAIDTFLNFLNKKEEFKVGLLRFNIFLISNLVCNRYLLYLWKKKIFIINNNLFLRKFEQYLSLFNLRKFFFKKKLNEFENSSLMILSSPPFNKNDFDQTQANNLCDKIGLNNNKEKKWICVHNRDDNYNNQWLKLKLHSKEIKNYNMNQNYRNFKLIDLKDSIKLFLQEGYQVVNMSFKNTEDLNINDKNYINYSQSNHKSDFADLFLLGNCELYFGSDSGANSIPQLFQRNSAILNISELFSYHLTRYWHNSLILPKVIIEKKNREKILFKNFRKFKLMRFPPDYRLYNNNFEYINNSKDEILEFAKEQIFFLKNRYYKFTKEDEKNKKQYLEIIKKICPSTNGFSIEKNNLFVSPYFLRKHIDLIR